MLAGCGGERAAFQGFEQVGQAVGLNRATHSGGAAKVHIRESLGQGACWLDYDRDGDPDLVLPNGAREMRAGYAGAEHLLEPWRLYENQSGRFIDVTSRAGLAVAAWGVGCATGDVDGDGLSDLLVTTASGPNRLLVNRGGRFEDATAVAGVGALGLSTSAAFGDLDGDGDLDLFLTNYLDESQPPPRERCNWKGASVMCGPHGYPMVADLFYLNDGAGVFTDATRRAGIDAHDGFGLGVVLFDADRDHDLDVYVSNDSSPNHLFLNSGTGSFVESAFAAGVALSEAGASQAGMGVEAADLDGDLDLFIANGHVFPEVDGGDPSTSYRQPVQLLLNDGGGRFSDGGWALRDNRPAAGRGAATADFDLDGDLDIVVTRDGEPPMLWKNGLPEAAGHWLRARLRGTEAGGRGLGAHVTLEAGGRAQVREVRANRGYLSASDPVASFGLGTLAGAGRLTVRWPSGRTQLIERPVVDHEILLFEPSVARPQSSGSIGRQSRSKVRE